MLSGAAADEVEDERDKPRVAEAATARRQKQPQSRHQHTTWLTTAGMLARRQQPAQSVTARYNKITDQEIANRRSTEPPRLRTAAQLITGRTVAAQEVNNTEGAINRPIVQSLEDIEIAYGDDRVAIITDFARRLSDAKTASERRAIKDQRKSALAAAKEKARRLKNARRASLLAATRQRSADQERSRPR